MIEIYGSINGEPQTRHYIFAKDIKVITDQPSQAIVRLSGGHQIITNDPIKTILKRVNDAVSDRYLVPKPNRKEFE